MKLSKRSTKSVLAVLTMAATSLLIVGAGPSRATAKRPSAPTAKEAVRFMIVHGDVALDPTSCASVKGADDRTLAHYLSTVLAAQTDSSIRWYIAISSKALGTPGDRWQIDVKFYGSDAGDTYDMGLRFVMDRAKKRIEPAAKCTGTS
jgi:hypothetical protein